MHEGVVEVAVEAVVVVHIVVVHIVVVVHISAIAITITIVAVPLAEALDTPPLSPICCHPVLTWIAISEKSSKVPSMTWYSCWMKLRSISDRGRFAPSVSFFSRCLPKNQGNPT
jgi:hypothetical protein